MTETVTADHAHRWRFHEVRQPGLAPSRVEWRCAVCGAVATTPEEAQR